MVWVPGSTGWGCMILTWGCLDLQQHYSIYPRRAGSATVGFLHTPPRRCFKTVSSINVICICFNFIREIYRIKTAYFTWSRGQTPSLALETPYIFPSLLIDSHTGVQYYMPQKFLWPTEVVWNTGALFSTSVETRSSILFPSVRLSVHTDP